MGRRGLRAAAAPARRPSLQLQAAAAAPRAAAGVPRPRRGLSEGGWLLHAGSAPGVPQSDPIARD